MNSKSETISLGKCRVRVLRDSTGGLQRLCLNDVCAFLGKNLASYGYNAPLFCPTSVRLPFKVGGRRLWSISLPEISTLAQTISAKKPELESRCRELEKWALELSKSQALVPASHTGQKPKPETIDKDAPASFNYQDKFPVSFRVQEKRIWINATQMTHGFKRHPKMWLQLKFTKQLRQELAAQGITGPYDSQVITARGRSLGATWIEAPLALNLAYWLDPKFSAWCRQRILEVMPEYELPDISVENQEPKAQRTAKRPEQFPVPRTFSEALKLAAELQGRLEQNEHKVAFYDDLIENRDWFSITRIADELQTTPHQLNRFLEDNNVSRYDGKHWVAREQYRRLQVEVPYMWHNKRGKVYKCGSTLRWNQEGREYIIKLWRAQNPLRHE